MFKKVLVLCLLAVLTITANLHGEDKLLVTADNIQFDKKTNTSYLKKAVIVRKSTGASLKSDKLEIEYQEKRSGKGNGEKNKALIPKRGKAKGNVVFKKEDRIITCKQAQFDRSRQWVKFSGNVVVRSDDFLLEGDRLTYEERTGHGKITEKPGKKVRMAYYKKNDTESKSTAETARNEIQASALKILILKMEKKLLLQGDVQIVDTSDQSKLSGDRVVLFFDRNNDVREMIATGNFSMTQPDRFVSADQAVFDYRTETILLTGNAHAKDKTQAEFTSSRIKMSMDASKGIISGADNAPVQMTIPIQ